MDEIEKNRADEITLLHGEIGSLLRTSLDKAIRIGELLSEQKSELKHGEFLLWVRANLPFTDRTAQNYMRLYDNREQLKNENVSHLAEGYKLLQGPVESTKKKSLLLQQNEIAEKRCRLEIAAGGCMTEMNKLLTPDPGHYIVGTAEPNIVFHIEGDELRVFKLKGKLGDGFTEKRHPVKDRDFWWYLYRYIGIHKIGAIWQDEDIVLSDEDMREIEGAVQARGFREVWDDDNFWRYLASIEKSRREFDAANFIESAHRLYGGLMDAHDRLCETYALLMGKPETV